MSNRANLINVIEWRPFHVRYRREKYGAPWDLDLGAQSAPGTTSLSQLAILYGLVKKTFFIASGSGRRGMKAIRSVRMLMPTAFGRSAIAHGRWRWEQRLIREKVTRSYVQQEIGGDCLFRSLRSGLETNLEPTPIEIFESLRGRPSLVTPLEQDDDCTTTR